MLFSLAPIALYVSTSLISFVVNRKSEPVIAPDQTRILRRNPIFSKLGVATMLVGLLIGIKGEFTANTDIVIYGLIVLMSGTMTLLLSTQIRFVRWNNDVIIGSEIGPRFGKRTIAFDDIVAFRRPGWLSPPWPNASYAVEDVNGHKIAWGYTLKGYSSLNAEIARRRPDLFETTPDMVASS